MFRLRRVRFTGVGKSPFQLALDAVMSPLAFAEQDHTAHQDRVRDLDTSVAEALDRTLALAIPADAREALGAVAGRLAEPLGEKERAREIERALRRLSHFVEDAWCEAALARPCSALPGVGPKRADTLARFGLRCVGDLLFHLPFHYDDRRSLDRIGDLDVGRRASFTARVVSSQFSQWHGHHGRRGGRTFQAVVADDTGSVTLKWFRGGEAIAKVAQEDALLLVTGDVKRYRFSKELVHPEIERCTEGGGESVGSERLERVVPEYAAPKGIHPRTLRGFIEAAITQYADLVVGHFPESRLKEKALPTPAEAIRQLHAPSRDCDIEALRSGCDAARARLVLEELYLLEVGIALRKARRAQEPGISITADGPRMQAVERSLPFALTRAQGRVWARIREDLGRASPMNRLLEGDVGSGKTVIAYLAAVAVAESGYQTALMAPTELLAEQHERTLRRLALRNREADPLRIGLLTASVARGQAEAVRSELAEGSLDLVVGTHSLIQKGVSFRCLALVVTDEQHRFGVKQRALLSKKIAGPEVEGGTTRALPHTLVMTATPIPRTLSLTLHGDLDLSVIDELPPGRKPVQTDLVRSGEGRRVADLVRATTKRGEQVYIVYPLVEESEKIDLRAVQQSAERIARAFPETKVDLVHGRLSAAERSDAMARFERGDTGILVSTTVIEVGVDVENATLMVVEHAERFGLAQLHQLRGRVGRGALPGTCVLVARGGTEESEARLRALVETTDGFAIAEADLRIRGPGEFLGTRQHGKLPDLRIADLLRDARHIATAQEAAWETVCSDPGLRNRAGLARAVAARWGDRLALVDVG